jgi:GNAT superfamily N-acetyltransferase
MGYLIRNLLKTDYSPQLFELLGQLTQAPIITQHQFDQFIDSLGLAKQASEEGPAKQASEEGPAKQASEEGPAKQAFKEGPLHQVVCLVDQDQIIGLGTIFIEHKIIHGLGKVAHIEDIVTDSKFRGQGLGAQIINHLVQQAKIAKCYKVILDCAEHNVGFYTKCGFEQKGVQMVKYF